MSLCLGCRDKWDKTRKLCLLPLNTYTDTVQRSDCSELCGNPFSYRFGMCEPCAARRHAFFFSKHRLCTRNFLKGTSDARMCGTRVNTIDCEFSLWDRCVREKNTVYVPKRMEHYYDEHTPRRILGGSRAMTCQNVMLSHSFFD